MLGLAVARAALPGGVCHRRVPLVGKGTGRTSVVLLVAMFTLAGCSASSILASPLPDDAAGADADPAALDADPAAPDAGVDARVPDNHPELIELCGARPQSLADWERCYQKRRCEWAVNCQLAGRYVSVEECLAYPSLVEGADVTADERNRAYAVTAGTAHIDVDTFARCLVATGAEQCKSAFLEATCKTRLVGTVADDGTCTTDVECRSPGATCVRDCTDSCCQGTCRPAYAEGEICDRFESCEPGLQCNFVDDEFDAFHCVAGDIGTACWHHGDCDPGAWCDLAAKTCKPDLAAGAPCSTLQQCGGETECVGMQRRLEPAACRRVSEPGDICDSVCLGSLYCALPTDRTQWGECVAAAEPGASCGSSGPYCSASYTCMGGTCVKRATEGQSCSRLACLPGLFCATDLPPSGQDPEPPPVCVSPQPAGARCSQPRHCESFRCSGDVTTPGVCLPGPAECSVSP